MSESSGIDLDTLIRLVDEHGSIEAAWRAHGKSSRDDFRAACRSAGVRARGKTASYEVSTKWGDGQARLVKSKSRELVIFLSDLHFPYQDADLVRSALDLIRDLRPDRVVLNGDLNDFFQLSRFNKDGSRIDDLQDEIDQANDFRAAVREASPEAIIDETEGNHDNRVISYVRANARALASLRALEPANLFLARELEINRHPGCGFLLRPDFLVKHGTFVRGEAGASAKAELLASGISGISGHVHRLATYRRAGYVTRQWTEQGCLCRIDPDYIPGRPNWTQGCAVGEFTPSSFVIHEVPAVDGSLRFGGASY